MGEIYKITNKITNGIYIGKTVKTAQVRWYGHVSEALHFIEDHPYILNDAIRKYGPDNFKVETIETITDDMLLLDREIYWISQYNSYYKNNPLGYNMTLGGEGNTKISTKTLLDLWNLGWSQKAIAQYLQINLNTVCARLQGLIPEAERLERARITKCKTVYQFTLDGILVATYASVNEASVAVGLAASSISNVLNKRNHTAGNFIWSYTLKDIAERVETYNHRFKHPRYNDQKVGKYDSDNNLIQIYNSISEAARQNNISSSSNITSCCQGRRKTCGGFIWKYITNNCASPQNSYTDSEQ